MTNYHQTSLSRTSSYTNTNQTISYLQPQLSLESDPGDINFHHRPLVRRSPSTFRRSSRIGLSMFLRSLMSFFTFPSLLPSCTWLAVSPHHSIIPSLGRKVTGTLFGHRRGHVSFAIQYDKRSEPVLLIEFAVSTSALVKEMTTGLVRIALECEGGGSAGRLFAEPVWSMYCNGRKCGYGNNSI